MTGKTYNNWIKGIGAVTIILAFSVIFHRLFFIPAIMGLLCMLAFGFTFEYDEDYH